MKASIENISNFPFVPRKIACFPCVIIIMHILTICYSNNAIFINKIDMHNGENVDVVQNIP